MFVGLWLKIDLTPSRLVDKIKLKGNNKPLMKIGIKQASFILS